MGVRRKEVAVRGKDLKGEESQEADDLNQNLRDFDIEGFSQPIFEVSEIGFTGDMGGRDTGIEEIMFSLLLITDDREESLQIGELLQVSEQFQKEEAEGVVGMSSPGGVS